jgi:hypothetical protein
MIVKDEGVRKQSIRNFHAILEIASVRFGELLSSLGELPNISLTTKEYDSGEWKTPLVYKETIHRVTTEILTDYYYKLSPAQMRLALIQGAITAGKLVVNGVVMTKPVTTKARPSARINRRTAIRQRTSLAPKPEI